MQRAQVLVLEGGGGGDATVGVEDEHLLHQVDREGVCIWVEGREGRRGLFWQCLYVLDRLGVFNDLKVLGGGGAKGLNDQAQLLQVVAPREERLAPEALGEDATNRPDVDALVVG